ncbi:Type 1 glutamine amidotransferase-like domain-containing protein [Yimella sp. cx-573]|nr:Type 1 glutamine amidotransferase-like domain-containing protein [Yimella sp. cx-573]
MKLYLSSYHLGHHPENFSEMVSGGRRVAVIMNASDVFGDSGREKYLQREVDDLGRFGLTASGLDLRDYFDNNDIEAELSNFEAVWVCGGNAFWLRQAMRRSKFDMAIRELVSKTALVYAGYSAGAVNAAESLKGIDLMDDPAQMPHGYSPDGRTDGLGLVNFVVVPHVESDHPESERARQAVGYLAANNFAYRAISDGQAVVVDGDRVETV